MRRALTISYEILEAVRRALVASDDPTTGVGPLVGDRIYPSDSKMLEDLTDGKLPAVTFNMLAETVDPCGRIDGTVQIDVIHKGQTKEKKTIWLVHRAIQLAVTPRLLQAVVPSPVPDLKINVALFRQESVEDNVFDERTDTYRLRSQWATKYVRTP